MKRVTFILTILCFSISIIANAQKGFIKDSDSAMPEIHHFEKKSTKQPLKETNFVKRKTTYVNKTIQDRDILCLILLSYIKEYYISKKSKIELKK